MKYKALNCLGLITTALTAPAPASAGEHMYMFHYSNFYSQLKHNTEDGHPDVRVGLFFIEQSSKSPCHIAEARLEYKTHQEQLDIYASGEVTVPIDSNLRKVNPMLYIKSISDQPCDISMRVLTKQPLQGEVSFAKLDDISQQMQTLLTDLSGSIGKWFTPKVSGVKLDFTEYENGILTTANGEEIQVNNFQASIDVSQFKTSDRITLPEATKHVTPMIVATK
jgi:hypothetical protein